MLHTQAPQINEIIEKAINQAQERNEPQLISVVDQIEPSDPFQFLDAGTSINNHCLFWRSAEEDFTMVAVGSAYKMYAENENRFKEIQVMWDNIHQSALTYDEFNEKGTGIVALGGFSFDSKQNDQVPWEAFPDSQMTIPAFLLTNKGPESYLTTNVLIFPEDHKQQIITQLSNHRETLLRAGHKTFELPVRTNSEEIDPSGWKKSIEQATEDIKKGLLDKVVLARELRISFNDPVQLAAVIEALAATQPNSYIFAFESEGEYFVGATPERLAKLDKQHLVSTCLAGTIRRGKTKEEDVQLGEELLYDPKNRQEHQFVVEMIRQAVEACCYNVQIPKAPVLYPLKNLQHLFTPVTAVLEKGYTLLDVIEKLHPTPALGGMPQKKSVDYIRTNEKLNRGWYAGPVGWFDMHNNGEFAVAIRSALIKSDRASLFAGCGVVEDSDPDAEYEETDVKLKPMLSVLGGC